MNTQRIDCGSELFFCVMDEIETLGFPEMPRNMIRHYSVIFLCVKRGCLKINFLPGSNNRFVRVSFFDRAAHD